MSSDSFQMLRSQLTQARQHADQVQAELFLAREKRQRLADALARLDRTFDQEDAATVAEHDRLRTLLEETTQRIERLSGRAAEAARAVGDGLRGFAELSDPRQSVERLDDAYPVLLLPVRLETRFKEVAGPAGPRHQLWVRVYPDDCAVDTFEEALTEAEVGSARRYWANVWRAGEDEALLRAAWRNLAAGHGAGRALWIIRHYEPLEGTEPPARTEDTLVLVIPTSQPLAGPTADRAAVFWEAVWRAHGDAAGQEAARAALRTDVGPDTARTIMKDYRPFNLDDPPPSASTHAGAAVRVETVTFEPDDETETKRRAWSRPPRVSVLPDRLVLLGYAGGAQVVEQLGEPIPSPLVVGPDPQAEAADQLRHDGDDIAVGEAMRWMVDFEEAVRIGMGFRVELTPEQYAAGLDRLLVLGVRLSADETAGRLDLERLLEDHHHSRGGLALLRQGTPTNNTDEGGADYTGSLDPDAGFEIVARDGRLFEPVSDWLDRTDGQWLAEMLGVDIDLFQRIEGADHTDVREAQAMNAALFPATIGYFMDTMMSPVFGEADIEFIRQFHTHFVTGRGLLSAVRIGEQPYGILPATVYSRIRWAPSREPVVRAVGLRQVPPQLPRLHEVLMRAWGVWADAGQRVSHVGQAGDPHQTLLDVLGLHATSVEFDQRYAESLEQVINNLNLQGWLDRLFQSFRLFAQGVAVLRAHRHDPNTDGRPQLLDKYFFGRTYPVDVDNLIHDLPLSEVEGIRPYTEDGRDYIEWLADAARASLEQVRTQAGLDERPTALLYRMLRHALTLGYYDTGVRLNAVARELPPAAVQQLRREATFIHVTENRAESESRFRLLYDGAASVGGAQGLTVADFITSVLDTAGDAERLRSQIAALERLRGLPTARLERAFVEHLDTCTYRLDAWLQGLVHFRLATMRAAGGQTGGQEGGRLGLYLGAFGWLEDVRPADVVREPVRLTDAALADVFDRPGDTELMRDPANAGYVHTPSPNHAVTAAVLRSGYRGNATPDEPDVFAVNLSSERVRRAMAVIEGIRNGQSLGALLGYQFERGLHDRHDEAEVDQFIFKLRKAFPLVADHIRDTARPVPDDATDTDESIEATEARNVLDGKAMVEHVLRTNDPIYPFGKLWLPDATGPQADVINDEVQRLLDTHDAVADLGVAEGIHQVVQGNYDRAAATLDAFSGGELSPIPDVVQTPRSGTGLTHRVGLHLRPGLAPTDSPVALPVTPRAAAEPALNHWLAGLLPPPDQVGVVVERVDRAGTVDRDLVTQADLELQPIDLLYLVNVEGDQAMTALDDLIVRHAAAGHPPDTVVAIRYTERIDPRRSFFEVGALISELRPLILGARPLRPTDLALPNEAEAGAASLPDYRPDRLTHVRDRLEAASGPLERLRALAVELEPLVDDPEANRQDLVDHIDGRVDRFIAAAAGLGRFGLPEAGFGFAVAWKRERYSALLTKVRDLLARWADRLDEHDTLIAEYDALPADVTDEARFERLAEAEARVRIEGDASLHATPAAYRAALDGRRTQFVAKRDAFAALLGTATPALATLLDDLDTVAADLELYDFVRLELDDDEDEIVRFSDDLLVHARNLVESTDERLATAADELAAYGATTTAGERAATFTAAAHALLGEDFLVIPEWGLAGPQAAELDLAAAARTTLLDHLTGTLEIDFPVDDWLYGVARVRPPMQRWEAAAVLAEALSGRELGLDPLQLPYHVDDRWLAMEYPPDQVVDTDKLLYTAHFAQPLDTDAAQCGLLLDEWTEVIPAVEETTGVSFHYDRPNSEPPQVMLLATPPELTGRWAWADLVDTLHETLELAKLRAVEPDHLADTDYARFVPTTVSAVTFSPITIALNYAVTNQVFNFVQTGGDGA